MNIESIGSVPASLLITSTALFALLIGFLWKFGLPAWQLERLLTGILKVLNSPDLLDVHDPNALDKAFPAEDGIAHLWREYKKTLYAIPEASKDGIAKIRWASTAPAEVVWNSQLAVDQRVGAEFFKHLPGIFTGLGIIGTFYGLIAGLGSFKVSQEPEVVRTSLTSLMGSVGEAFSVSAAAISLAILVTLIEKVVLTRLYGKIDAIASSLDRRFQAAVAEEFLELTAGHTEETATQL